MTSTDRPTDGAEQMSLLRAAGRRRPGPSVGSRGAGARSPAPLAVERPVARVAVDVSLPHLDRPFDYLVPESMAAAAVPGARVRVRFSGRLVGGFVLERDERSAHAGTLSALHAVVSAEPVLSRELLELARAVADRYAGSLADVLRLAVPARHGRAEALPEVPASGPPPAPAAGCWAAYDGGSQLLDALARGTPARAVWSALPAEDWPDGLARAVGATISGGHGALVVVPDRRDLDRVDAALLDTVGPGHHVVLSADLGPAERYRRWLAVRRGTVPAVVGTRAAMFAPVARLGLVAIWDDGDDLHAEQHAPYPHARTVLCMRSSREGSALIIGGFTRTVEAAGLVASGWAREVSAERRLVRRSAPVVRVAGEEADLARDPAARGARLPTLAWRTAQEALRLGPVLVQVPRAGYLPSLACAGCRAAARCTRCHGPLGTVAGDGPPACSWCGVAAAHWECPHCGSRRTRARVVGAGRTAEELGRAFPRHPVRASGGDCVIATVGPEPALVVATPGAEPVAEGGYAAALLLDGWALLTRADLRAGEEALRRWLGAAALVRQGHHGGQVVVLADASSPAVQALVRWDPGTFADRELADRTESLLPPAVRMASLTGGPDALRRFLDVARLPDEAVVLGPVPDRTGRGEGAERLLVRVPRQAGHRLTQALRDAARERSAHKETGAVRVQVDPLVVA